MLDIPSSEAFHHLEPSDNIRECLAITLCKLEPKYHCYIFGIDILLSFHRYLCIDSLTSVFMYCSTVGLLLRNSSIVIWCWASSAFLYCWLRRVAAWLIFSLDCWLCVLPYIGLFAPWRSGLCFSCWLTFMLLSILLCCLKYLLIYDLVWLQFIFNKYTMRLENTNWNTCFSHFLSIYLQYRIFYNQTIEKCNRLIIFYTDVNLIYSIYTWGWKVSASGFISLPTFFQKATWCR